MLKIRHLRPGFSEFQILAPLCPIRLGSRRRFQVGTDFLANVVDDHDFRPGKEEQGFARDYKPARENPKRFVALDRADAALASVPPLAVLRHDSLRRTANPQAGLLAPPVHAWIHLF
jgi:hypothetical protein